MTQTDFSSLGEFPEGLPVLVVYGTLGVNPFIRGTYDGRVAAHETCLNNLHDHLEVRAEHSLNCYSTKVSRAAKEYLSR